MRLSFSAGLAIAFAGFAMQGRAQAEGEHAPQVEIDRFSDQAGHLFKRSASPELPGPNAPIDFDQGPFITRGLGPDGENVSYYNFDVQAREPAKIYVLFKHGSDAPVEGQHNIVDSIPGDAGYSDFWNVVKVTVPDDYAADTIRSVEDLLAANYPTETTTTVVNCPIVPAGSTARLRYDGDVDVGLHDGWYQGGRVQYFNFSERSLTLTAHGLVPISPIYVTFNKNPDPSDPTSGPASGFVVERDTGRAHNVIGTLPENQFYSPLWNVSVYDNQAFGFVHDLASGGIL